MLISPIQQIAHGNVVPTSLSQHTTHSNVPSRKLLSDKCIPDSAFEIFVHENMNAKLCFNGYALLFWNLNQERIRCGCATCYEAFKIIIKEVNSKYGRHFLSNEDR